MGTVELGLPACDSSLHRARSPVLRAREVTRTERMGLPVWEQTLEAEGEEGSGPGATQRARGLPRASWGSDSLRSASDLGLVQSWV